MANVALWNHDAISSSIPPEKLILTYGKITAFSRELPLKSSCWIIESSEQTHVNSSLKTHVGLRNHHNILI